MLPTKFRFIWLSGFKGEDLFKSANQKQELPVVAITANVTYCSPQLCNFIEPINTRFLHVFM
jgi:hypothetical protein